MLTLKPQQTVSSESLYAELNWRDYMGGRALAADDDGAAFYIYDTRTGDPVTAVYVPFGPSGSTSSSSSIRRTSGGRPTRHGPPAGYTFGPQGKRYSRGEYVKGQWHSNVIHNPRGFTHHRRPSKPLLGTSRTSYWYQQQNARRHRRRKTSSFAKSGRRYQWGT